MKKLTGRRIVPGAGTIQGLADAGSKRIPNLPTDIKELQAIDKAIRRIMAEEDILKAKKMESKLWAFLQGAKGVNQRKLGDLGKDNKVSAPSEREVKKLAKRGGYRSKRRK